MNGRRSRIRVLIDILRVVNDSGIARPTHILYKANLSHKLMKEYLNMLIQNEFIVPVKRPGGVYYKITDKGKDFIIQFKNMEKIASGFGITV